MLQMRRVLSVLFRNNQLSSSFLNNETMRQVLPSASSVFTRDDFCRREFQTHTDSSHQANEDSENEVAGSLKPNSDPANASFKINSDDNPAQKPSDVSNLKISSRHDLAMIFTCKVCETRSIKTLCRESYEKGVVVARCGGCNNLHLIADRLGWFGEPGSVEDLLAARGEEVKKGSVDTLNLTLDDIAGKKLLE